ncbi:hypothetical protein D3C86_2077280 [compost metagenome]
MPMTEGKLGQLGGEAEDGCPENGKQNEARKETWHIQPVLRFQQSKGQARIVTCLPCRKLSDDRRHQRKSASHFETRKETR